MTTSGLLKWGEQVYTVFDVRWDLKDVHRKHFFEYSVLCLVAGFVYSRSRSTVTDGWGVNTYVHFKHMWVPSGAVNTLQDFTTRIVSLCYSVQTLVCCLREPCVKVQSHRQWPQCSSNWLARTFSEDAGQSDCKSPFPLLLTCSVWISKHVLRVGGESRCGKHNGWNSRDHWPETSGKRTVLESEFEVPSVCENTKNECCFWFSCSVSSEKEMSVLPLDKDLFVLAPIRRIVWTSDQTEFVVVHFPCVVSVHAQFMTTCMTQDFQVCVVRVKTRSSPCHPCLHLRTHLHPLACTWAFNFCLPIPQPHLHLRLRCRSTNTAKIHKMKSVAQWPIQPLPQVMSPTWSTTSTTQRLTQRSSKNKSVDVDTEPSYSIDAELDDELIRKTLSSQLFTQEREENQRTWDILITLMKKVCYQPSPFFTRTSTERPVYEPREELQKSHVLKVEELSRRKLSEDFEEVTSFFQGSNVKTVYILGYNDAKYTKCWDWRRAHQELAGFTTVPSGARSKCDPVAGLSLTKRKLVSTCTVNF